MGMSGARRFIVSQWKTAKTEKFQQSMAMRDMVTGGAACAVPGSSSTSNPIGALANALIGTSSKTQERLNEIPTTTSTGSSRPFNLESSLPGTELEYQQNQNFTNQGNAFLDRFHATNQGGLADAWNEIQSPLGQHHPYANGQPNFTAPHHIYDQGQLPLDGPPREVLSNFLHSFVNSSRGGMPFHSASLPTLGLTKGDKQCIRDRSSIMARHFFADKSEDFIHAQVDALLGSLDIDSDAQMKMPLPGRFREMEDYWNESQRALAPVGPVPPAANGWVSEFGQYRAQHAGPDDWVNSFEQQHGPNGWASEFERDQLMLTSANNAPGAHVSNIALMEQSRRLAHTLSQNSDPKFQNSKFHQFMSKMSRGDVYVDGNQFKSNSASASGDWAAEYQEQHNGGLSGAVHAPDKWASEFVSGSMQHETVEDPWVDEFSKLHIDDWAEEFGRQVGEGAIGESSTDGWLQAYDEYINEQIAAKQHLNGEYVYSDMNPYVGHPDPLKEGQELFRKGLLSEAVLALEAEVLKNPGNSEGWRLLGIAHAENDDDQQAIASMLKAQQADPANLEVLLALGVSHTNELEQAAALKYLYQWLHNHPKYGTLAPQEASDSLYHADVSRIFNDAAQISPEDADIHIVLGVLYNLSREYDKAIESFKTALALKPQDYSLWNKLGATQANSIQSADAILAYQQALDLKPNYVRAWANMGISYANQGMFDDSIRYYVRALAMNPKADNAWQYLRISLSSASRNDMLEACDARNLDLLQKEFPL